VLEVQVYKRNHRFSTPNLPIKGEISREILNFRYEQRQNNDLVFSEGFPEGQKALNISNNMIRLRAIEP